MITIVDYKMGNLGSIQNMLKKIGTPAQITSDPEVILKAEKIILPGVGGFSGGMTNLKEMNLLEVLDIKAQKEKVPVLGICLGMQLLGNSSEEGPGQGLGWIPSSSHRFQFLEKDTRLKVPHIGWNYINKKRTHPLLEQTDETTRFYFVHSYYVRCNTDDHVIATSQYGIEFHSIIGRDNIMGAQFHPEKSHRYGMTLLQNFSKV